MGYWFLFKINLPVNDIRLTNILISQATALVHKNGIQNGVEKEFENGAKKVDVGRLITVPAVL